MTTETKPPVTCDPLEARAAHTLMLIYAPSMLEADAAVVDCAEKGCWAAAQMSRDQHALAATHVVGAFLTWVKS